MIRSVFHFNRKFIRPHITPRNTRKFIGFATAFFLIDKSYRFYEEYAWKHEGLRRMKKVFYDDEDYVINNSLSFEDFLCSNYTTPMINIEPRNIEEVSLLQLFRYLSFFWVFKPRRRC
jgi:hypothetical protein